MPGRARDPIARSFRIEQVTVISIIAGLFAHDEGPAPVAGSVEREVAVGIESAGLPVLESARRSVRPSGSARTAKGGEGESARRGTGDGPLHAARLSANEGPSVGGKDDDGDRAAGNILLRGKALVCGNKGAKTGFLGLIEQLPIGITRPPHLAGGPHVVAGEDAAQLSGNILVEQNSHAFEGAVIFA